MLTWKTVDADRMSLFIFHQHTLFHFQLGGVHPRTMFNLPDGTFDLDHIESNIRPENDSHQPVTGLICVEDTHNVCGGVVLPLDFLTKVRDAFIYVRFFCDELAFWLLRV